MIRRIPTMIPMSDADVQEIRDLVAEQKAHFDAKQKIIFKTKLFAEARNQGGDPDPEGTQWLKQLADRHRRLGIPSTTGPRTSGLIETRSVRGVRTDGTIYRFR